MEGVLFSRIWKLHGNLPDKEITKPNQGGNRNFNRVLKDMHSNFIWTTLSPHLLQYLSTWLSENRINLRSFWKRQVQPFVYIWTSQGNEIHEQVYLSMLIKIRLTLKGSFFPALKSIVFILMFLVPKMHKLEVNLVNSSKHFWCHFVNNSYTWLASFLHWSQFQFAIYITVKW